MENIEDLQDVAMELEEIQSQMLGLLERARRVVRGTGIIYKRADRYWLADIKAALVNNHEFCCGSMVTMQDTIEELLDAEDDEDEA